jgi:flagellar hook protein FlgE
MLLDMNLNAAATAGPPADTFATSIEIFDSLGSPHTVTANFTKNATAGQWDYSISVPDADLQNPPFTPLTGSITFNPNGKLATPLPTDPMPKLEIQGFADGAADMTVANGTEVTWNLYNGTTPRISQFSHASAISAIGQDGAAAAQLVKVSVGDEGKIFAQYSDGVQVVVAQMAMASVRNPGTMIAAGNNNYQLGASSALPAIGVAGTGGRGAVVGGAVESSTVDIAREFTNLIVYQRGYQANSRVITTVDQISQDTINLIHP